MKKLAFFAAVVTIAAFSCWATEGYDDLVKLVKSGVGEEVVLAFINSSATGFALTPDEILHLKDMGASNKVLTAAIQKKKSAAEAQPQKSASSLNSADKTVDTSATNQTEPSAGKWVLMNDYWYWQYPTGVIVDLGWQPYYYWGYHWYPRGHWGGWGGGHRWR